MTHQVFCSAGLLVDHAGPRLVHDLDCAELDARENELSIWIRDLIRDGEAEPIDPEFDAGLDGVYDENRSELLELELRHAFSYD
jgi:hypothetical protein